MLEQSFIKYRLLHYRNDACTKPIAMQPNAICNLSIVILIDNYVGLNN